MLSGKIYTILCVCAHALTCVYPVCVQKDKYACVCMCPECVRKDIYEKLLIRVSWQAGALGEQERNCSFSSLVCFTRLLPCACITFIINKLDVKNKTHTEKLFFFF